MYLTESARSMSIFHSSLSVATSSTSARGNWTWEQQKFENSFYSLCPQNDKTKCSKVFQSNGIRTYVGFKKIHRFRIILKSCEIMFPTSKSLSCWYVISTGRYVSSMMFSRSLNSAKERVMN